MKMERKIRYIEVSAMPFHGNFYLCPERTEYEDSLCGGSACCDCGCDFEDFSD